MYYFESHAINKILPINSRKVGSSCDAKPASLKSIASVIFTSAQGTRRYIFSC